MRKNELEAWVYRILERVESRRPVEDNHVELKRAWIEPEKAARQVAGHANVSRGEPILWIIGADEKQGAIVGAAHQEFSEWHSKFKSCFDQVTPELLNHDNITWETKSAPAEKKVVTGLLFETEQAPYVVKNPSGGHVTFEVPWRSGTDTYSANRSHLLRILAPLQRLPDLELMECTLFARPARTYPQNLNSTPIEGYLEFVVEFRFFVVPQFQQVLVIPNHACRIALEIPGFVRKHFFDFRGFAVIDKGALLNTHGDQLTAHGPGYFSVSSFLNVSSPHLGFQDVDARVTLALKPAGSELPVIMTKVLKPERDAKKYLALWQFQKVDDSIAGV